MSRKPLIAGLVLLALLVAAAFLVRRLLDPDSVRAAVEQQASAYLGQPVKVAEVHWSLLGGPRVVLTRVEIGSPPAVTLGRVEMATGLRALLSRRVEHGSITVSRSRVAVPLPIPLGRRDETAGAPGPPAGAPSTPPGAPGTPGGPGTPRDDSSRFTIVSIDRISLDDMDLVSGENHVRLDLQSSLAGDRLLVPSFELKSARTKVSGSGEFSSLSAWRGHFSAIGDPLDLDEWLALASASHRQARAADGGTAATSLDVRIDMEAPRGRLLGAEFRKLKTTAAVTGNGMSLAPLTIGLFDGAVRGRIRVETASEPARGTLTASIEGMDVSQLAAAAGHGGVLTGRLQGEVQLATDIGALAVMTRRAGGTGRVVVTEGTAPGLDLVRPVVLAFGRPDPGATAAPDRSFSRLSGTFTLTGGVLRSDDLLMNARDVDLRGGGTVDLVRATVDVKADLVLSESLSAQAGRDLIRYAHEGSRVVLPAKITGSLASPSVSIDTAAALGRALRNTLGDRIRKLFKR